MTSPHWMLPGVLAPLRKPRVRWLADPDTEDKLPIDVPPELIKDAAPAGPVPNKALAPHPTGYSTATPIVNPDTSLALADVSLSARMTAAGTVQSYQTQMCYPKIQQDFRGLLAGSPEYAAGFAAGQAVFSANKPGLRSDLPTHGQLGYAGQQRDEAMGLKWIEETPGTVGTVFSYAPASRTPIFKPSASRAWVTPAPSPYLPACPPGFKRVGNDCAKMYPCPAGWEFTAQSPTQCVKVTCPDDRRYDAKHGCVPVICPAKQVWSNKANKCVDKVNDYLPTDSFLMLSGTPNQVGAPAQSRVRWLGEVPGRLGATNDSWNGEPNVPSPIVLSAWDFEKCTYVLQPGDTIDGLAQTYLKCQAGDFVAGSGKCISLINNANLHTKGYNGNANLILFAGSTINMPPAACAFAKAEYARQKEACAQRQGFTWDDNIKACNPSTGTPIPVCLPCQSSAACPLIQKGDMGDAVLQWNQILVRDAAISGATFTPDNGFGDLTYTATVAWQTAKGLTADGVVGPLTWGLACCPVGQANKNGVCVAPPKCSETTACPPATYCRSGNCVKPPFLAPCPADLDNVNGTCMAKCPKGKVRDKKDPTKCIQAVSTAGSGGDAGVLVLALGALGALALTFMGKDKGAGGMTSNPHRASHYARRTPASRRVVRASW